MFATMTTSSPAGLSSSALLQPPDGPSPIGFEATLSVAMELENRLKAEMEKPEHAGRDTGTAGGNNGGGYCRGSEAREANGSPTELPHSSPALPTDGATKPDCDGEGSEGSLNGESDHSALLPETNLDEEEDEDEDGSGGAGGDITDHTIARMQNDFDLKCNEDPCLKCHLKEIKAENGVGESHHVPRVTAQGKVKTYRCKQCSFVATTKADFWAHNKTHIRAEKLLTCPRCPFVTEYKHHLEYHLRNHYGSKPFKCNKCSYSCVNKSMLNSHMKSHSNVYQYRCADCSYATKYCHSLKLHLRKYAHKPSTVLNMDGSPTFPPVIDVYGTRRGPRSKKGGHGNPDDHCPPPGFPSLPIPLPFLYPPMLNGLHEPKQEPNPHDGALKCSLCEFMTPAREVYSRHLLLHAASENQDLCKLYGISSDALLVDPKSSQPLPSLPPHPPHSSPHNQPPPNIYLNAGVRIMEGPPQRSVIFSPALMASMRRPLPQDTPLGLHLSERQHQHQKQQQQLQQQLQQQHHHQQQQIQQQHEQQLQQQFQQQQQQQQQQLQQQQHHVQTNKDGAAPLDLSNSRENGAKSSPVHPQLSPQLPPQIPPQLQPHHLIQAMIQPQQHHHMNTNIRSPLQKSSPPPAPLTAPPPQVTQNQLQVQPQVRPQSHSPPHPSLLQASPQPRTESLTPVNGKPQLKSQTPPLLEPEVEPTPPKHRRKGRAVRLDRICLRLQQGRQTPPPTHDEDSNCSDTNGHLSPSPESERFPDKVVGLVRPDVPRDPENMVMLRPMPKLPPCLENGIENGREDGTKFLSQKNILWREAYECQYCDISFRDCIMYTMHMGYHGYKDPFKCNMCGQNTQDKVAFFLHIARTAHV